VKTAHPTGERPAALLSSGPVPFVFKRLYELAGWKVEGEVPTTRKFVLIAAPHTTNWDFPVFAGAALKLGFPPNWMGKAGLFKPPWGGLMRGLGGVAVERSRTNNLVDQMVAAFARAEQMILTIPPEGTRHATRAWKSGFWHIARGAGVPVVMGFADYRRKVAGLGPTLWPSEDFEADMEKINAFYADVTPKHPERFLPHGPDPVATGG
jgi:1-acyl-sn-glycerol-3-phosphate acyltransferase